MIGVRIIQNGSIIEINRPTSWYREPTGMISRPRAAPKQTIITIILNYWTFRRLRWEQFGEYFHLLYSGKSKLWINFLKII